jgi:UDP-N-acetylmuramoylalanine--D-glutamate ligase
LAALDSFDEPLVLLAGGRDKALPWERLAARAVERVRLLVLFGEAAPLIEEHVAAARTAARSSGEPMALECVVMVGALQSAVEIAAKRALPGDVVLLSPGGTSFDAFSDFAERGMRFREWVNQL